MFTLTVRDEQVFKRLMEKVQSSGESLDEVLREMLDHEEEAAESEEETPAQRLLRLIDAADLQFTSPFDARDADDIIAREAGKMDWRTDEGDNGTP
jgi:negative regulator of replication initiation